jgi:hypothetical protein
LLPPSIGDIRLATSEQNRLPRGLGLTTLVIAAADLPPKWPVV